MKRRFALLLAGGLLALDPAAAQAQSAPPPVPAVPPPPAAVPPFEILTMLRSTALEPIGRPVRHGAHYLVRAVDRFGEEVRVVVDARNGRIRTITPIGDGPRYAAPSAPRFYGPGPYDGPGPRVVRVLPDDDELYAPGGYPAGPRMAPRVAPPHTRAAARPPLPRARPGEGAPPVQPPAAAPVRAAPDPAPQSAPEPAAGPAADGATPPPIGFE